MPAIQTTYNNRQRVGVPGLVANMETANSISRIVQEAAGIGFGLPVVKGTTDTGILEYDAFVYGAVSAARAGNTGNGTITPTPATAVGVKAGVYTVTNVEPLANSGKFEVEDPDGVNLGVATVGVAFVGGGLTFTIADGATDFVAGDAFDITVTASAGGGEFEGITIRDATLVAQPGETVDVYQQGDTAAILVAGVIWVVAGGAVVARKQAYFNPATKRFTGSNAAGAVALPNCVFDTSATTNGDLVKLRVSAY